MGSTPTRSERSAVWHSYRWWRRRRRCRLSADASRSTWRGLGGEYRVFFQDLLDGAYPNVPLVADKSGRLFGTSNGPHQDSGTVFELTPPSTPGSPWTEHTLWVFGVVPGDGGNPVQGLTLLDGKLYGATQVGGAYGEGTVFQLTPPAALGSPWTETILHSFNPNSATFDGQQPESHVVLGPGGALYGVTWGSSAGWPDGAVYEVTP